MFALVAGTSFILYMHRYTWNFIRPELKKEFDFNNTELGVLDTAFNASYASGQIPGGIVCDLFGPHFVVGAIIGLWSLILACMGMAGSLQGLAVARAGFGIGQAGCYPSLAKITREWFPAGKRTILQGLIASFFGRSGGAASSLLFASFLMGFCGMGWRWALAALCLIGVIYAFIFVALCRNRPEDDPAVNEAELAIIREGDLPQDANAPRVLPVGRALKNRSLLMFILQQYMNAGADFIYSSLMGSFFIEARSVEDQVVLGLLVSMPLWGGACGGIAGGFMNDILIRITGSRRKARTIVGFSGKFFATGFLYLALVQDNPMASAWLLFVTKFFSDWTQPTVWGAATDMGGRYSATAFSIINTAGGVGGTITPMLGGLLLDGYATSEIVDGAQVMVTHYEPVFIMVGAMYLASAVCWLFINVENTLDRVETPAETE